MTLQLRNLQLHCSLRATSPESNVDVHCCAGGWGEASLQGQSTQTRRSFRLVCACVCARVCQAAPLGLRPALGCACGGLRLCPRLWLMHAVVRVLTRYNHQLQIRCTDVSPLRPRLSLGHPRPGTPGGPGPGLRLHVGRGLCLRDLQRRFVLRIRVLFPMQQRRLGRHLCKYHIHKYHKAS